MKIINSHFFLGNVYCLYLLVSFVFVGCENQEKEEKIDPLVTISAVESGGLINIRFDSAEFELGTMGFESSSEEIEGGIRHRFSIDGYTADLKAERIDGRFFLTVLGSDQVFVDRRNSRYEFSGEGGISLDRLKPGKRYEVKRKGQ